VYPSTSQLHTLYSQYRKCAKRVPFEERRGRQGDDECELHERRVNVTAAASCTTRAGTASAATATAAAWRAATKLALHFGRRSWLLRHGGV